MEENSMVWATNEADTFTREPIANIVQAVEFYDQANGPHSDTSFKGSPVKRINFGALYGSEAVHCGCIVNSLCGEAHYLGACACV